MWDRLRDWYGFSRYVENGRLWSAWFAWANRNLEPNAGVREKAKMWRGGRRAR